MFYYLVWFTLALDRQRGKTKIVEFVVRRSIPLMDSSTYRRGKIGHLETNI